MIRSLVSTLLRYPDVPSVDSQMIKRPTTIVREGKSVDPKNRTACAVPLYLQRAAKLLLVVMLLVGVQQQSRAGFVYSFNTSGTDQDFLVGAGAIVQVPVYLVQTDGENRLSIIGLFSAGASVTYTNGSIGAPVSATVNSATLATHWNDPYLNLVSNQPGRVVLEAGVDDIALPALTVTNAILLGTIQFQAGELGNVTNLQLSLNGVTPLANNLVNAAEVTPITFRLGTITAVPEPTSLCLVAVASVLVIRRRRLRVTGTAD